MGDNEKPLCIAGNPGNYVRIVWLILFAFLIWSLLLVVLNLSPMQGYLRHWFGDQKPLFLELYCWGALGGTLAAYVFFAHDKDTNEREALKTKPNPSELRYPDSMDVCLYGLRILFSGLQGVAGALILYAGLIYFNVPTTDAPVRRKVFFSLFSFLVGLNQKAFLAFLDRLTQRFLTLKDKDKAEK